MKERLTSEQSAELIKRGIDPTKASCFEAKSGRLVGINQGGFEPIFTRSDLLMLIPQGIAYEDESIDTLYNLALHLLDNHIKLD